MPHGTQCEMDVRIRRMGSFQQGQNNSRGMSPADSARQGHELGSHRQQGPQASHRQGPMASYRPGAMMSHRGDVSHRVQRRPSFSVANDEAFFEHGITRMAAKITNREVWLQQV